MGDATAWQVPPPDNGRRECRIVYEGNCVSIVLTLSCMKTWLGGLNLTSYTVQYIQYYKELLTRSFIQLPYLYVGLNRM